MSPDRITGHLSPTRDQDVPSLIERGRRGLAGRKGYSDAHTTPSPSSSNRSASISGRSPSLGHRRHASGSGSGLSPDLSGRPSPRGRGGGASARARRAARGGAGPRRTHRGGGGGEGYNADEPEGRKGYNDNGQPSPDSLEPSQRSHHSRSASVASGSDKHSPSPVRNKFSPDPQVDYSPRPHLGIGGRKGYNTHNTSGQNPSPLGIDRVPQEDGDVGLGISGHGGIGGRKGYNSGSRTASPAGALGRR